MSSQLPDLIQLLRQLDADLTPTEVAEMLWLATRLPTESASGESKPLPITPVNPPVLPEDENARPSVPPQREENLGKTITLHDEEGTGGASTAQLFPEQAKSAESGQGASPIRSPAAFALPGALEIARNLRPFKRRVPSRTQRIFDEPATAHRIADTGDWMPVLTPAPERWLNVALIVDESSSMVIWQRMIDELQQLLARQGAFRTIELFGFRGQNDNREITLYRGIGPTANRDRPHRPTELNDPLGRRLLLLVSDCVAPVWHNGVMANLLATWGQSGLVAIVQPLPDRLWVRTGLRTFPTIHLRSPAPGLPNQQFEWEWSGYRPRSYAKKSLAIPVVTLEALSLGYLAQALAGKSNLWIPGVFALIRPEMTTAASLPPTAPARPAASADADELLRIFYGTASPTARRLANFFSAMPLTLPIMRLVQQALLPESGIAHLAEVFLSGLIERPTQPDDSKAADSVEYFFVKGVREQLANNLRVTETLSVLDAVSTYIGERTGQPLDFGALIADPKASGELTIEADYQPFARIAASALRRYGGQYAELATRLDRSLGGNGKPQEVGAGVTHLGQAGERQRRTPRSGQPVTVHGLLIGINEYAAPDVPKLQAAVNDVQRTQAWLQERFSVNPSNVQTLLDRQATKQTILAALRQLADRLKEGDHLFIHYSGLDQQLATDDPNEGDGLEETLFVYDSQPNQRATLITHRELVELLRPLDQRGVQVILFLDVCRSGSGYLCRHDLGDMLVMAAAHEAEMSYEGLIGNIRAGYASYYLAEAMQRVQPGRTWAEVFDSVYVNVLAKQENQTLQWIGARDLCVFSEERKPVEPYLLVSAVHGDEITVCAHPALDLEIGARLVLYPPGSDMSDLPLRYATVNAIQATTVTATVETLYQQSYATSAIVVGSRVRVVAPTAEPLLTVAWDSELIAPTSNPLFRVTSPQEAADYRLRIEREPISFVQNNNIEAASPATWRLEDGDGRVVWQQPLANGTDPATQLDPVRELLHAIARYRRIFIQQPPPEERDLADAIELTVLSSQEAEEGTILADQPTQVRLHNRSKSDLYISLWTLDNHLGIQRIYPPTSDCLLLGKGRQIQLTMTLNSGNIEQMEEQITFKVFASRTPADLSVLQQERMAQAVDLGDLQKLLTAQTRETEPTPPASQKRPTRKQRPQKRAESSAVDDSAPYGGGQAADSHKLWPNGSILRVCFLEGDPKVQEQVMQAAQEWSQYANITFQRVDDKEAEIRISFDPKTGAWSYIGTDATLPTLKDKASMNFGWLKLDTDTKEIQRVVLHEFGIALGLINAHLSPAANIPWNQAKVIEYYQRTNGWTEATVRSNLLTKASVDRFAPPDPKSIMHFPIPKELTDGKFEVGMNYELSEGDKRFIAELYPRTESAA